MAYTTTAKVKELAGVQGSGDDALIATLIPAAQAAVDQYYLRTFEAAADTTRYFDAVRDVSGQRLSLDRDLHTITSVVNGNGVTVTAGQYTTLPVTDRPIYAIQLKASSGINWQWVNDSENAIAVTGKWAYSLTAPDSVAYLCTWLATYMYKNKDNVLSAGVGPGLSFAVSVLSGDVPPDIRLIMSTIPRRAVI